MTQKGTASNPGRFSQPILDLADAITSGSDPAIPRFQAVGRDPRWTVTSGDLPVDGFLIDPLDWPHFYPDRIAAARPPMHDAVDDTKSPQ